MQYTKKILITFIIILSITSTTFAAEPANQEELKLQISALMEQIERLHLGQKTISSVPVTKTVPSSTSTSTNAPLSYTQKFSDSNFGITFSYNQPKKLSVQKIYKVNGESVVARSFSGQGDEALFISLTDKEDAANLKLGFIMLSMLSGITNENGETIYISNRPVYIRGEFHSSVIDLEVKNKNNDSTGSFIWMQEVKNDSGVIIGSVNTTVGWGESSRFTPSTTKTTYNGKAVTHQAYFKTRLEAEVFMKEVMATMSINSGTVLNLIE